MDVSSPPPVPAPPGGKWLQDESGREYFVDRVPKKHAERREDNSVRTIWGIPIEVVKEDDEYFYYKYYKTEPLVVPTPAAPSAAEIQAIKDSYRTKTPQSNRLRFSPFGAGLPTSGQWRDGFAIADMNGDGHPDIVHGPARKSLGPPVIFLGDGKGSWRRWTEATFPSLSYDYGDAQVADFDGDGHLDIVLVNHLKGTIALRGDGKGNFSDTSAGLDFELKGATGFSSRALRIVDWDEDGRPDLLVLGEGPAGPGRHEWSRGAIVYLNRADGTWLRRDPLAPATVFGASLALGDFNGDGHTDFATGSSVQGRKDIVNLWQYGAVWKTVDVEAIRTRAYVWAVAAADFDHDGRADLAVAYGSFEKDNTWRNGIDILYSRSNDSWERRPLFSSEGQVGVVALATGDLDGDKNVDLVALTDEGKVQVYLGDGKGFLTVERKPPEFAGGCRGAHIELADLDGDGRDEMVASFADEPEEGSDRCPSGGGLAAWKADPR